jgi:hypothetical protein
MQFAELCRLSKEDIREAYRYPTFMLGTVQDVNRNTAEASETYYQKRIVKTRLDRIKEQANFRLLPMFASGAGHEFAYGNVVPADTEADNAERNSKADAWSKLVVAGANPDDAADVVGLPRMRFRQPQQPQPQEQTDPEMAGAFA